MKKTLLILCLGIVIFTGCKKKDDDDNNINPTSTETLTPSPMGNVGTTFTTSGISGISNINLEITANTNNISTIHGTIKVDDPLMLAALALPTFQESWYTMDVNGNAAGDIKIKFSIEGITSYIDNNLSKPFTVLKYDWQVGDSTSASIDKDGVIDSVITRKCTARSNNDDYYWNGMYIKTLTVTEKHKEYTITYIANHKFGIVCMKLEYGSSSGETKVTSSVYNS